MTTSYCRHSPSLSRTGNVLHSFRQSAFACLSFNKVEEVQHIIVIPSDSHSGINYPPTFVIPPLSPERETFRKLSFCQLLHSSPLLDKGIVKRLSINMLESRFTMLFNFIGYLICMIAPGLPVFLIPPRNFQTRFTSRTCFSEFGFVVEEPASGGASRADAVFHAFCLSFLCCCCQVGCCIFAKYLFSFF